MHIKHFFKLIIIACIAILTFSCSKDNQSFKYEPINDIRIQDGGTSVTVVQRDSLIITPELLETLPAGDSFSYRWTIDSVVVSQTKNLRLKVLLSPRTYTAIYRVTSNKNGIYALQRYKITVTGAYPDGWYIVNSKNGKGQVSLIRTDDVIFDNPMEVANNKSYPGKPLALYNYGKAGFFYYFTDQNTYRFNMNDWLEISNISSTLPGFASSLPFQNKPVFGLSNAKFDQYIVADGGLYAGVAGNTSDDIKPFSQRIPGDYNLFHGVFPGNYNLTYFYDNKTMRFMQMGYLSRILSYSPATPAASFDMANVGKKMIAYDRGISTFDEEGIEWYYIMEDKNGRYLLSTTGEPSSSSPGYNQQMLNSPEIANADNFATSSVLKQVYYTVGNRVYLYDILANSSTLIYNFPGAYVIKDIEMLRKTSKQLVIGVNNGAVGEVYYFDIDGRGQFINNTYAKKFTGFGEIIQIAPARQYQDIVYGN